jgi:hypothetical protein
MVNTASIPTSAPKVRQFLDSLYIADEDRRARFMNGVYGFYVSVMSVYMLGTVAAIACAVG